MDPETKKRGRPRGNTATRDVSDELDLLIERRSRNVTDADEAHELWKESVRRYHRMQEEEHREAWCQYERHMATLHAQLAREHEERAAALENE